MGARLTEQTRKVATAFVSARRQGRDLAEYPGERPVDLAEAYRIQDTAISLDGRPIVGWKVGRINPPDQARLGTNRLAGPIFADTVVRAAPGDAPQMPVFAGGFAAVEAEFLLHLAPGWGATLPQNDADARALIDEVRLGIEVASSPYSRINADGPPVTASDYGNNGGLVIGPALAGWQELDLCAIPVKTEIDGQRVGEATAAAMLDGPYGAVRFIIAHLVQRQLGVGEGLWVSTGAVTGVHQIAPGQAATAQFGGYGGTACRIVAASGQ